MVVDKVIAKVFRYDPSVDSSSRFETFEVPYRDKLTVLEVLRYIYENYEPIAFRYSCRYLQCGSCSVQINGKPGLACGTYVHPGEVTIEPLKGFPIIKDLVVDRRKINQRALEMRPYLQRITPPEREPEVLPPEQTNKFYEMLDCRNCYSCYAACPLTGLAWSKFSGPALMTKYLALRAYDPRDEADRIREAVLEGLWYCAQCYKCKEVCWKGIDIPTKVFKRLREEAVEAGIEPPRRYKQLADVAAKTDRIFEASGKSLLEIMPERITVEDPIAKVGVFVGCVFDYLQQDAGKAALEVLKRNHVEIVLPKDQVCCGMPMFSTGQSKVVASHLLKKNIEAFEKANVETVVTICPSCGMTWKKDIPRMAETVLKRKPKFEVIDVHEFLASKVKLSKDEMKPVKAKVTFHDACHLRRGMGIYEEPRALTRMIPGVEFVEMKEADRCCGGFLRYLDPTLANKIGTVKLNLAKDTSADLIATTCPLCVSQMSLIIKKMRLPNVEVLTVMKLLMRAYTGNM